MNINKSFSYALEDKEWLKKFLIGLLVSYVPIVNFAWPGYITDIMHDVSNNQYSGLPEWDDFGDKFIKGLLITIAGLVYAWHLVPGSQRTIWLFLTVLILLI